MKLHLPKWLRADATDAEKVSVDRRLFLRGLTLTSAGLIVGVPMISIPRPTKRWTFIRTHHYQICSPDTMALIMAMEPGTEIVGIYGQPRKIRTDVNYVGSVEEAIAEAKKATAGKENTKVRILGPGAPDHIEHPAAAQGLVPMYAPLKAVDWKAARFDL